MPMLLRNYQGEDIYIEMRPRSAVGTDTEINWGNYMHVRELRGPFLVLNPHANLSIVMSVST